MNYLVIIYHTPNIYFVTFLYDSIYLSFPTCLSNYTTHLSMNSYYTILYSAVLWAMIYKLFCFLSSF